MGLDKFEWLLSLDLTQLTNQEREEVVRAASEMFERMKQHISVQRAEIMIKGSELRRRRDEFSKWIKSPLQDW